MTTRDDVARLHGYHRLRVAEIVQETHDTRSFVLDVPPDLAELFTYRSGQFCTFRVHVAGEEVIRSYSMSSAPETDARLTVTVKRVAGGKVSNWFHDHVSVGDALEVMKPAGVFCVHEGDRPVVAFAGGSGITPVISIAKTVLATTERRVRLLYANRDAASVIFAAELAALQEGWGGRIEVHHHLDSAGGYLTADQLAAFVGGTVDADFYICGPNPFMDLAEATVLGLGAPAERIAIERFINVHEPAPAAAPAAQGTESVTLIVKRKKHKLAYQAGDTILDTARRGAVQTPFSCEAGNCASCMALIVEGSAQMRANNALTPAEVADGWVLTCQGLPTSPTITVEFDPR